MKRASMILASALVGLSVYGCGGDDGFEPGETPQATDFPAPDGRTLAEIAADIPAADLVASPGQLVTERGENRYAFGVFELDRTMVNDAEVALYFAPGADGEARGPYPADVELLEAAPAFRSQTSAGTGGAPEVAYVVPDVDLNRNGEWQILAVFKAEDGLEATRMPSTSVGRFKGIPGPGDPAPDIHTTTASDVGGDYSKIETRVPPDQMHGVDFADVIGKKPVVLLFATPAFCESRLCGPVVDVAEQVREEFGDDVAFIHNEVFNENDPSKGVRPELRAFNLGSEPWLFVFDADGKVAKRIEGPFSVDELRSAVRSAQ